MHEDYYGLQLKFAKHYAVLANVSFASAITRCTNLRRRLNLLGASGEEAWVSVLQRASDRPNSLTSVLHRCLQLQTRNSTDSKIPAFGCFSYDSPDDSGVVRVHFMPPDGQSASPLSSENLAKRHDELRAMFGNIRRVESCAKVVRGVSWLYNVPAYRRLFPDEYVASIERPPFPVHLNGSSTWGQVLDWQQEVKPEVQGALLRNMTHMQAQAPWEVFPLQALMAQCGIGAFYERFT